MEGSITDASRQDLPQQQLNPIHDSRLEVVAEIVQTERSYVSDLGKLCDLRHALLQGGQVETKDVEILFSNIPRIYELHQRFLVDIEPMESLGSWAQVSSRFASLFVQYEHEFAVYLAYLPSSCVFDREAYVRGLLDKIQATGHEIADDFYTLDRYLLRPYSRFVKYNVFMAHFLRYSTSSEKTPLLRDGMSASERIIERGMMAIDVANLQVAEERLHPRVESWKNLKREELGVLLLHGYFYAQVIDRYTRKKFEMYLFEDWLLFFKPRDGSSGRARRDMSDDNIARSNLVLMGRLSMWSITEAAEFPATPPTSAAAATLQGSSPLRISWKEPDGTHTVDVWFPNDTLRTKWFKKIDQQRAIASRRMEAHAQAQTRAWARTEQRQLEVTAGDHLRIHLGLGFDPDC
ncbi:Dbl homology domain-containing protein [Xylariales sp. PMI_506]|nr:Dbl homology domain-containing protein [Xylariales sp. PMI_506]